MTREGVAACVCGATDREACKRPVGLACVREQELAAARWANRPKVTDPRNQEAEPNG